MGATTNFTIGPVPATVVAMGQAIGPMRGMGGLNMVMVPFSVKMSNSYSTGGDTITYQTTPPLLPGLQPLLVVISPNKYGANWYTWDGSQTTPKIQAWTAFNTEAGAIDLSAVTVTGWMLLTG